MRKFWFGLFIVAVLSLLLVPSALALDHQSGTHLVIDQSQTLDDDLIFTGESLIIDGTVHGDVYAFGQAVTVNGTIDGNLVAFGSMVDIKGSVKGTVFAGVNDLRALGRIDGSLVAGGNTITVDRTASVGRNLLIAGDQLRNNGAVGRDILAGGRSLSIGGQVGRGVEVYGNNLHIGSGAVVSGPVVYHGTQPAVVDPSAHTGKITYYQLKSQSGNFSFPVINPIWRTALKFAGFVLVGLVLFSLFPGLKTSFPEAIRQKPGQSLLAGLLALVVVPVSIVILLVTVVGIPLAVVSLLLFPVTIYIGQVLLSWTVGLLLSDRIDSLRDVNWAVLFLIGALVTSVLVVLPIVGGLMKGIAVLVGLGGLYYTLLQKRQSA